MDDSGGSELYKRTRQLNWTATEAQIGKLIKVRGLSFGQKGEVVPRHCLYRQDGIYRHERLGSRFNR